MDRVKFIEELHIIGTLLQGLIISTEQKLEENRRVRKLLKLPDTVHNKTKLTNYLKYGNK